MKKKRNEKVIDISSTVSEDGREPASLQRTRRRKKKAKKDLFSTVLLCVSVIGLIVGGGILGNVLWSEYTRKVQTKTFLVEAAELTEKLIPRSEFKPAEGDVVGIITFPDRDNLQVPIVEGVREEDLKAGIGHEPATGWPTDQRQVFLSGHRNTEFGVLQHVVVGERIEVKMPYGNFIYRVTGNKIVPDTAIEEIKPNDFFDKDQLALMTCYPFTFGAATDERYFIYAERVE